MNFSLRWKNIFINYIRNNFKEYILTALLFLIGIFIGVMIINNCEETELSEISEYILNFIEKFKELESLNRLELIINSAKNNVILALILWLAGTTIVGIPIVLIVLFFRGLCLGYTLSMITYTLGTIKGISFCLASIVLQNILFIPAILTLGVSSIKLYKSILKDRQRENIKIEIIRHTIISILMSIILILSAIIENVISLAILQKIINYF